jgi:hypothetical protein
VAWTFLLPLVAALVGYAGFCYKRQDTIVREGRGWIREYLDIVSNRQKGAMGEVMKHVLPELAVSFVRLPADEPLMSDAELSVAAKAIRAEASGPDKGYIFRERVTAPIVRAVTRQIVGALPELADSLALTPGAEAALLQLELPAVDYRSMQEKLRMLRGWYLLQLVTTLASALLFLMAGLLADTPFLVAGGAVLVVLIPLATVTEYVRRWIDNTLDVDRNPGELKAGQ